MSKNHPSYKAKKLQKLIQIKYKLISSIDNIRIVETMEIDNMQ